MLKKEELHCTAPPILCPTFLGQYKPIKIEKAEQANLDRLKIKIVYDEMVGCFSKNARKKFVEVEKEGLDVRKKIM
ncbi:hypothetical protein [Sneathia sanguinegens]|uniref:hypothetical protein n=1 Tax=Sneathia sanguinegens TaxID=40543 RepID=UPI0023FA4667|nr:hypothetical protein [Sneathia sanguinegens]